MIFKVKTIPIILRFIPPPNDIRYYFALSIKIINFALAAMQEKQKPQGRITGYYKIYYT